MGAMGERHGLTAKAGRGAVSTAAGCSRGLRPALPAAPSHGRRPPPPPPPSRAPARLHTHTPLLQARHGHRQGGGVGDLAAALGQRRIGLEPGVGGQVQPGADCGGGGGGERRTRGPRWWATRGADGARRRQGAVRSWARVTERTQRGAHPGVARRPGRSPRTGRAAPPRQGPRPARAALAGGVAWGWGGLRRRHQPRG